MATSDDAVEIGPNTLCINYTLYKGDSLKQELEYLDEDDVVVPLSLSTARLQVKDLATDTVSHFQLTQTNGITLADTLPNISYLMTSAQINLLAVGRYVYDMELIDVTGFVETLVSGSIVILQDVTR